MAEGKRDARYHRGLDRIREVGGMHASEGFLAALADVASQLGDYVVEFVYGDVFANPALTTREQELVTLAGLTALGGCEGQIRLHVACALRAGISPNEIIATMTHCAAYAGFPRALNAVQVAKEVFAERDLLPLTSSKSR